MGMFSFVRGAGEKMFGGKDLDEAGIRQHVLDQGIALNPFTVVLEAKAGKVSLIGFAATVEDKEKAIIAAGNMKGVESVEDRLKIGMPEWMVKKQAELATAAGTADAAATAVEAQPDSELEQEPAAEEAPTSRFYTVVSGDTLGKIAKEMYGSAGKYPVIFEANKPMLSNPDRIYPGQVLRIP